MTSARDQFIKDAQAELKKYCEEGDTYRCLIQVKADCSHGIPDRKDYACKTLSKVEALEKKSLAVDKSLSEMSDEEAAPKIVKTLPPAETKPQIKVPEVLGQVKVTPGSHETNEGKEEFKILKDLQDKINSHKVRMDCSGPSECTLQDFGHWGCGGPNGTVVYSLKGDVTQLKSNIEKFSELDKTYNKKFNSGATYTCALKNRTDPPKCVSNICQ